MTTSASTATAIDLVGYDEDALGRLADLLAERLALRLNGRAPVRSEPLVDAAEIARLHGKTRSWVYEHAGELGAVRLGSGPRPRLGFSPARVAEQLEKSTGRRPLRCLRPHRRDAGASVPIARRPGHRCCMYGHTRHRSPRVLTGAPLDPRLPPDA